MRKLILFLILISNYSLAQDCKGIKTTKDEMAGMIKSETPLSFMGPKIQAVKILKEGKETSFIHFSLTWPVKNYLAKGVLIKLSDSTFIREEDVNVTCSYIKATGSYMYSGSIILNEEYVSRLSKNRMIVFRVGEGQNTIGDKFAAKFMDYINCLFVSK